MSVPATLDNLFPKSVDIGNSGEKTYIYISASIYYVGHLENYIHFRATKKGRDPLLSRAKGPGIDKIHPETPRKNKKNDLGEDLEFCRFGP